MILQARVKHLLLTTLCATLAVCSGCSPMMSAGSGSEAGNSDGIILASSFIKLPSSVAKPSQQNPGLARKVSGETAFQSATELYDGVRECLGLANELIHNDEFGAIAIIKAWHNALDWRAIRRVGMHTAEQDGFTFTASYSEGRSYAYQLLIRRSATAAPIALMVDYNGDKERPHGRAYVYLDQLDSSITLGVRYTVEFQVTDSGRSSDVNISSDRVAKTGSDEVQKISLRLFERDAQIHLSGAIYLPNLDSLIPDTTGYCYVFTGIADTILDRSMINLGIPPAGYPRNDAALFTTYSFSRMFGNAFLRNEIGRLEDTIKSIIVTSYIDSMTFQEILDTIFVRGNADFLYPPDSITTMTIEQLEYVLTLNQDVVDSTTRQDFIALLWLLKLRQPVYFSSGGYAGNGEIAPHGFEYLAGVKLFLEPLVPDAVRAMNVTP